tara:strand:- start:298 stop:786 length:489 start_codon:yes stop_codon:yes gene_type:complete
MKLDEIIDNYLTRNDWKYIWIKEEGHFTFGFEGVNGAMFCCLQVRNNDQIMFYSTYIHAIKPDEIYKMVEFITRENYRLVVGNFEIDVDDGELNYKTSVDMTNRDYISDEEISNLIHVNLSTMDRNIPRLDEITGFDSNPPDKTSFNEEDIITWKKKMERFE